MLSSRPVSLRHLLSCFCLAALFPVIGQAGDEPSVSGSMTANGTTVELPYVYVWALEKGFYNDDDAAWKVVFVQHPIAERELDDPIWDSAYVELGLTRTAEFSEQPRIEVYSQSIKLSAESAGNVSGGTYPTLELTSTGPDRFAGRAYLPEPQTFFDDTVQYDLTFSAPLSNPKAPIGDPLPADGGAPGAAYLAWVAAVHSGDLDRIRALVPAEMAGPLAADDAKDMLELIAAMTPTEVKVLGGSSDGQTALLEVEGTMDGEAVHGEITLERMGDVWVATKSSW